MSPMATDFRRGGMQSQTRGEARRGGEYSAAERRQGVAAGGAKRNPWTMGRASAPAPAGAEAAEGGGRTKDGKGPYGAAFLSPAFASDAAAAPHSGQRSGVARRSYPHWR